MLPRAVCQRGLPAPALQRAAARPWSSFQAAPPALPRLVSSGCCGVWGVGSQARWHSTANCTEPRIQPGTKLPARPARAHELWARGVAASGGGRAFGVSVAGRAEAGGHENCVGFQCEKAAEGKCVCLNIRKKRAEGHVKLPKEEIEKRCQGCPVFPCLEHEYADVDCQAWQDCTDWIEDGTSKGY